MRHCKVGSRLMTIVVSVGALLRFGFGIWIPKVSGLQELGGFRRRQNDLLES